MLLGELVLVVEREVEGGGVHLEWAGGREGVDGGIVERLV